MIVPSTSGGDIEYDELATLKELATRGALTEEITVSCPELADRFEVSKQTMARRLRRLLDTDHIERELSKDGQLVVVTDRGRSALRAEFEAYRRLFDQPETVELRGTVVDGLGEGRHYIGLPGYWDQFREQLGYAPFPGTLNVALDGESAEKASMLEEFDTICIDPWEDGGQTYGGATCLPVQLESSSGDRYNDAHAILPNRTDHENQLELIAPDVLRDRLNLESDHRVSIHVTT